MFLSAAEGYLLNPFTGLAVACVLTVVGWKLNLAGSNWLLLAAWILATMSVFRTPPLPKQPLIPRVLVTMFFASLSGLGLYSISLWTPPLVTAEDGRDFGAKLDSQAEKLSHILELLSPVQNRVYRELVATIIQSLDPNADIKVGDSVQGPDGARQVDIVVRSVVDGKPKLVAIEVYDLPRDKKAGVEVIDAIESKRNDIHADAALVCSNTGFDATALRKGKRTGIGLISVLRQGDQRVKAIIEEEIYLRRIWVLPMQVQFLYADAASDITIGTLDLRYQGKPVTAWLQGKAVEFTIANPDTGPVTIVFNLKKMTEFEIPGRRIRVGAIAITFSPRTEWLAQTVQLDASSGIYDYVRRRVRLAGPGFFYVINGVDFDSATPMTSPPPPESVRGSLAPGEIKLFLVRVEGFHGGLAPPNLDELVRPEDLDLDLKGAPLTKSPSGN